MGLADPLHKRMSMGRAGISSIGSLSGFSAPVIDSEKERRTLVSGILRDGGALVTPVETPDAALTIMELLKPDVGDAPDGGGPGAQGVVSSPGRPEGEGELTR